MTVLSRWRLSSGSFSSIRRYSSRKLKILFFGTDGFSIHSLQALHNESCNSEGAISRLESCCSEMKKLVPPVKKLSDQLSIACNPWPPDPDLCAKFDLGIVASFGHLIPSRIINAFPLGMLNVHGSILPRWRGAAPIVHAIMNGDTSTGVSIMEIQPLHFDLGKVLATRECLIGPNETRGELSDKMAKLGANLMLEVVLNLSEYQKNSKSQPSEGISYAPKITTSMLEIHWSKKTSTQVYNQYRALADISKLYSFWKGSSEKVRFDNIVHPDNLNEQWLHERYPDHQPGEAVSVKKKGHERLICIKCAQGWVAFKSFYYGPRKHMTASDFYSGFMSSQISGGSKPSFVASAAEIKRTSC